MQDIISAYEDVNQVKDKKRTYFYVSSLGKCRRQVIFGMEGRKRKSYTVGELNRFQSGTLSQRNWEYAWKRKDILLKSELYLPKVLGTDRFHGRIDDLLTNLTFNDDFFKRCDVYDPYDFLKKIKPTNIILLEFKTARSYSFAYQDQMLRYPHQLQTWMYLLHLLKYMPSIKIQRHPLIFYVDRDGTNKPVLFVLDKPTLKKNYTILKKEMVNLVKAYVLFKKKKVLPDILDRELKLVKKKIKDVIQYKIQLKAYWECSYCKYHRACKLPKERLKTNIIGTIKENKFEPNKNYEKFKKEIDDKKINNLIKELENGKTKV